MVTALRKATTKQAPLDRVRVLKLIHQNGPIPLPQRRKPRRLGITGVHGCQQTGEGDGTTAAAAARQFPQPPAQGVPPDPFQWTIQQGCDGPLQLRRRQAGFGFTTASGGRAPGPGMEVVHQGRGDLQASRQ